MKKYVTALLALLLVFSTACAQAAEPGGYHENLTAPGEYPVCKEPIQMTVGIMQHSMVEDYENNYLTNLYREMTNIDFVFETYPEKGVQEKLSIMVASQSALPEVLTGMALSDANVIAFSDAKAIIALDSLIEIYGFNIKDRFAERPNMVKYARMPDGNLYSVPRFTEQTGNQWSGRAIINRKWLDTLGLDMPRTTDEFYEVLKAFKTKDPNGNGVDDEIPMLGNLSGWRESPYDFLFNAFIYNDYAERYVVEDGVLSLAYMQPEWQAALIYANKLCTEDLLSARSFTLDAAQWEQIVRNKPDTLVGVMPSGGVRLEATDPRREDYEVLPPLTGPEGVSWAAHFPTFPLHSFAITRDCKNPEAAIRWADLMYDSEMAIIQRWGEKGVEWDEPGPDDKGMFEDTLQIAARVKIIKDIWPVVQNKHWRETAATFRSSAYSDGQVWNGNPLDGEYLISRHVMSYIGKAPDVTVGKLVFTADESSAINEIKTQLNEYVKESTARFVTGDMNPEREWEAYLRELTKIGVEQYLSVCQDAYDRMSR